MVVILAKAKSLLKRRPFCPSNSFAQRTVLLRCIKSTLASFLRPKTFPKLCGFDRLLSICPETELSEAIFQAAQDGDVSISSNRKLIDQVNEAEKLKADSKAKDRHLSLHHSPALLRTL